MLDKAKKMWEMQAKAKAVQKELRAMEFVGEELGGRIKVVVNGEQKVESIAIDEALFTPSEKTSVERFLKQAMSSAVSKSQQTAANKMKEVAKDMGIGL